ncbi:MAG: hypothetical protein JWL77_822 [Chthonomonadaceae bacterium]|nr:hypothetical protein [Chthonomonadaceae bacterium]
MECTEEQKIQAAYHEAGHAVAGILLGGRNIHVGIGRLDTRGEWIQKENSTGNTLTIYPISNYDRVAACSLLRRKIIEAFAGLVGVRVNKPELTDFDMSTGFNDHDLIEDLAHSLVKLTLQAETPAEIKETWRRQQMVALAGMAQNFLYRLDFQHAVHVLANALMERKQLEGNEATVIIVKALAAKGTTISPPELSACFLDLSQTVQESK